MSKKFMVTSALPYANGPIHLGHIAGAYLPADIFVRFQRAIGNEVLYICGTDEHGVPITLRAEQENVTPRTIVQRYHENIKHAFQRLNIAFDTFSGTSQLHNKHHAKISREFFLNLLQNGLVVSRLSDQHFCEKCSRFLPDRFIQGICPNCGYPEARGDECSQCNRPFDPLALKSPKCKICGNLPTVKSTKHWYFKLDVMQKELQTWLDTKTGQWKENVLNFVNSWLKQGLQERAITRDLYWGVPVPLHEEAAGKVLYVWFDAPIGYISATMEWAESQGNIEKWREYWQNPNCQIVHFIGKDNIPFHAIIWPAMLLGQRLNYELPWQIPANEYLTFGVTGGELSEKASKSKGNVVWVHDALDVFPADIIRYYLASSSPERNDTMFTWRDFQKKSNNELLGVLGNLCNRILKFIEKNFDGQIPELGPLSPRDQEMRQHILTTLNKVCENFDHFEVKAAVAEIVNLGRLGNQYFDEKAPWKTFRENKADCQTCMCIGAELIQAIAVMLGPILPESMQKLWQQLGHADIPNHWDFATRKLPVGHKIGKPEALFQKVEDDVVLPLERKLAAAVEQSNKAPAPVSVSTPVAPTAPAVASTPTAPVPTPSMPAVASTPTAPVPTPSMPAVASTPTPTPATSHPTEAKEITIEEFQRLEIRMAEVIAAQKVPKAKKLLQLTVKIGEETRTVISGIAESYEPEQLIGKKVPLLTNLKPATIRGVVSQGMILCADDGLPVLLLPARDVPSGSPVR